LLWPLTLPNRHLHRELRRQQQHHIDQLHRLILPWTTKKHHVIYRHLSDKDDTSVTQAAAAQKLSQVAKRAFQLYPGNCSGAVHYVITQLVNPASQYRLANQLLQWFASPHSGWQQVKTLKEASALADQGKVVVGGLMNPTGHGHVIIVLPGPWKPAGGYYAHGQLMPRFGLYPPAMSTAWSPPGQAPWPGAVSDGDKTVFDPWFNTNKITFNKVKFWTKP
jgi:hypothetical protein